jgi:hypothetical protein
MGPSKYTVFFWQARVCWPLLCLCRPFCIFERCLDSNPESRRSKIDPSCETASLLPVLLQPEHHLQASGHRLNIVVLLQNKKDHSAGCFVTLLIKYFSLSTELIPKYQNTIDFFSSAHKTDSSPVFRIRKNILWIWIPRS